ncbi:GNAT family N-acetyltransferase [Singulisphaera sp. Ch08]|uniref:GNAT family N-acetyltransferase n=1 Tax=Singulisphaera sp. Ch08 TaxID=3120278 RepID=A0AAU7CH47_9BACT
MAVEVVAGGRVIFAGAGSPLTEAKAIGLHGAVTEADVDRMEAAFFGRGEPARVVVCPLADPSFVESLGRRGYRIAGFENFLILPLGSDDAETPLTPEIEVRPIGSGELELYARVVASNFVGPGEPPDEALEMTVTMLGAAHASAFLACIDGEPVGGGAVLIHRGVALLAGAATLPPYRNRGVQAALHHARLALARRSGCDLAAQGAEPGSTSQRNAERRGFRIAYTRAILVRDPA